MMAAFYRLAHPRLRFLLWLPLSEHTEQGRGPLRAVLRRLLLKIADGVIVNGSSGARYVRRLGVPSSRTYVIPYTTDISPFKAIPLARDSHEAERRFVVVGQLIQRKGVIEFFSGLRQWAYSHQDQAVRVLVVGDGPLKTILEQFQMPPNVEVQLKPGVPYDELPEVYSQAGILVFPTLADEWGLVVNEALASGLPVLGSIYSQAVNELIEEDKTGWLFTPDNVGSVQSGLDRVSEVDLASLHEMRKNCRQRAEAVSPSWAADKMLQAIVGRDPEVSQHQ